MHSHTVAYRFAFVSLLVALLVLPVIPAFEQAAHAQQTSSGTMDFSEEWKLTADSIEASHDSEIVTAVGNVTLVNGANTLSADYARFYNGPKWVYLKGNVNTHWDEYEIHADEGEFDLTTRTGKLRNGIIFAEEPHLYIEGAEISKTGDNTYTFMEAKVTACDGASPAWTINVSEGDITVGGYANLWHSTFNVSDAPILYTPYASLPVKLKRESGFLFPVFGTSSRLGAFYGQPYYWAIDEERDLTATLTGFSSRGVMAGLEYRHQPDIATQGLWQADFIHDSKRVTELGDMDSQFEDEGLVRKNYNRYWIRSKYDGWIFNPNIKTKLDLDLVSDHTFLRTFDVGQMEYEKIEESFLDRFGRGLDVIDSKNRTSQLLVSRQWSEFSVNARMKYTQNLNYQGGNLSAKDNPTVQTMPELSAYAYKQQLGPSPFEVEGMTALTYFAREEGSTGARFDVHPRLSLPLVSGYGSVIPSIGYRQSYYSASNRDEDTENNSDSTHSRGLPDAKISAFTEVFRTFALDNGPLPQTAEYLGNSTWTDLQHIIQPRAEYSWIPNIDQDGLPEFDDDDRIEAKNEVKYSLTNIISRKRSTIIPGEADGEVLTHDDILEFFRFRLENSYDFNEASRNSQTATYERRPFGDIIAELRIMPEDYISLTSRTFMSPYTGDITEHEHMLRLMHQQYGSIYAGLDFLGAVDEYKRQNRERQRTLRLGGQLYLPYNMVFNVDYQTNIDATDERKRFALTYRHQCYDVTLALSQTPHETQVLAWFTLMGLSTSELGL